MDSGLRGHGSDPESRSQATAGAGDCARQSEAGQTDVAATPCGHELLGLTGASLLAATEPHTLIEPLCRTVMEHSPCASLVCRNDAVVLLNAAALSLFGATDPAQLLGRPAPALFAPDEQAALRQWLGRSQTGQANAPIERQIVRLDGRPCSVEAHAVHLSDGEGPTILLILHDISERKRCEARLLQRAEELAEANREQESFSYSISHDLRTPLYALTGFSDLLYAEYAGRLDERGRNLLRRIKTNATTMNEFITSMLSLARISRQQLQLQEVDLSAMAAGLIEELQRLRPDRCVTVRVEKGLQVRADSGLIKLALCNLIGNAWKYTGKTANPTIEFASLAGQDRKVFFLRDNGAGFEEQFAQRVFSPFQRLHAEKEFSGTGVGLAIVEKVIRRHGGTIWAEGAVGRGATFFFTLGG